MNYQPIAVPTSRLVVRVPGVMAVPLAPTSHIQASKVQRSGVIKRLDGISTMDFSLRHRMIAIAAKITVKVSFKVFFFFQASFY